MCWLDRELVRNGRWSSASRSLLGRPRGMEGGTAGVQSFWSRDTPCATAAAEAGDNGAEIRFLDGAVTPPATDDFAEVA